MSQQHLADAAGLSLRTVVAIEKGRPVKDANARKVEQAVGIGLPEWALVPARFVERGDIAALIQIVASTWPESADRYYLFVRSLVLDAGGNHEKALVLLNAAMTCDECTDGAFSCAAWIQLACIQDHRKEYDEAQKAAERAIAIAKTGHLQAELLWWGEYQLAIALINLGKLTEAHSRLLGLKESAKQHGCEVAAMHQLGVLQFDLGRFADAAEMVEKCITLREEDSPRLAYEYHGLGKVCGELKDWQRCSQNLQRALKIALQHGFERYANDIRATAQRYESTSKKRLLGPSPTSLPNTL